MFILCLYKLHFMPSLCIKHGKPVSTVLEWVLIWRHITGGPVQRFYQRRPDKTHTANQMQGNLKLWHLTYTGYVDIMHLLKEDKIVYEQILMAHIFCHYSNVTSPSEQMYRNNPGTPQKVKLYLIIFHFLLYFIFPIYCS